MSTLQVLQDLLMKEFRLSEDQVSPEIALNTLGIDSLDLIDFFFKVEDRFDLKLKDDMPATLITVNDIAQYIDSLAVRQENLLEMPVAQSTTIE